MAWNRNRRPDGFRSSLESEWANWFTGHDIPWEYEPVKFKRRYTPDFRIYGTVYIEVKGIGLSPNSGIYLVGEAGFPLLMLYGSPKSYECFYFPAGEGGHREPNFNIALDKALSFYR
jgi:hypothetical protein